jgi:hypothetical protein
MFRREFSWSLPIWLLALAVAGGCGSRSLPSAADATVARESLQAMLASWERGERADDLKTRRPAIVAIDGDWSAGLRLVKSEVRGACQPQGVGLRSSVLLSLQDGSGKTFDREAVYTIGTSPIITIARSDRTDESESGAVSSAQPVVRREVDRDRD